MSTRIDPRLASLTPERLTEIVESGGGEIADTWDHIFTPNEKRTSEDSFGFHVLYLGLREETIGSVGFEMVNDGDGGATYRLFDFEDYRYSTVGSQGQPVGDNERGFVTLLAAFAPTMMFTF